MILSVRKRNGGDSPNFYVGSFNEQDYGTRSVYVYRNQAPYLLVTLDQRTVIFNGGTPEKTAEYYSQLKVFQLFP